MRNLPIIMLSMSRWDGALSSAAYALAKELAKHNQVFYLDYPYTIKEFVAERHTDAVKRRRDAILYQKSIYRQVPNLPENFVAVTPSMTLSFDFLPPGPAYELASYVNNQILHKTIRAILHDYQLDRFILFNSFNPFYVAQVLRDVTPDLYVYQARDDIRAIDALRKHGPKQERKVLRHADLLLATSTNLKRVLERESGRPVHLLPNAAQTALFQTALHAFPVPAELEGNTRKVIGFIGNLEGRNDFALLEKVIRHHTDKLFLFIGPYEYQQSTSTDFHAFENVLFVGPKPLEALPQYLHFMDCTIIPFQKNDFTRSIYPLKLNEQLAAGKAIVTTNFSEDLAPFRDVIYLAESHDDFVKMLNDAVAPADEMQVRQRVQRAQGNSWAHRVELFWQLVEQTQAVPDVAGRPVLAPHELLPH
ncbi:Glycosyltransferase involved in cell wall bisynthesis [Catalinimonas alkaloidigena]|uniref:Glycosyltransferase involved in cell wall bisynthesis n=1 Tax=Catalinimonas alkaloidigena TaxID=1075417 RepID=A0A1G9H368_9BACT|nr:glycosyltransferase [Catalinimonas alkaloidigena]SDL07339.1 Glycosyltransferase involved in cell wall bisynthesis [Catalinimonas alkaloidigena]